MPLRASFAFFSAVLLLCAQDASVDLSASQLETRLNADPGNENVRAALMDALAKSGDTTGYFQQVSWLINNRPESQVLNTRGKLRPNGGPLNTPADYETAKSDWEPQLLKHPSSAAVLYNAAVFLTPADPSRAVHLFEEARGIAPTAQDYAAAEGIAYLMAFTTDPDGKPLPPLTKPTAQALKASLDSQENAEILSGVGKLLATEGLEPKTRRKGVELMRRVADRDPTNPKWRAVLASADVHSSSPSSLRAGAVPLSGEAAEQNIIRKVDPVYPILAKSGRIEGDVKFKAMIDEDGTVQNLELISGPEMLVGAAKDAILQWQYQATLVDGKPVPVTTEVGVSFKLNQ